MNRCMTLVAICILAGVALARNAHAQCPLTTLSGTWTFQIEGVAVPFASVGRFTATVNNNRGVLNIVETSNNTGFFLPFAAGVFRDNNFTGTFQLNSDCSGGILQFATAQTGIFVGRVFEFFFAHAGNEMFFVNIDNTGNFPLVTKGSAKKS